MKKILLKVFVLLALVGLTRPVFANDAATNGIRSDIMPIVTQIQQKLQAGKRTEADLAENLKAIDGVIVKYRNDDREELAGVYLIKAQIFYEILNNDAKATETLNTVKKDFAGTAAVDIADKYLEQIKAAAATKAISRALAVGTKFPDFAEKDLSGQPLSVAGSKGKVILIDFWATWCPPCRAELPNVIAIYKKYHAQGFEVIGINLDEDRARLEKFIKSAGMTWPQYFDGLRWENKLVKKYGVDSIPMTYLLEADGKILGKELRGEELEAAVAKALAGK